MEVNTDRPGPMVVTRAKVLCVCGGGGGRGERDNQTSGKCVSSKAVAAADDSRVAGWNTAGVGTWQADGGWHKRHVKPVPALSSRPPLSPDLQTLLSPRIIPRRILHFSAGYWRLLPDKGMLQGGGGRGVEGKGGGGAGKKGSTASYVITIS